MRNSHYAPSSWYQNIGVTEETSFVDGDLGGRLIHAWNRQGAEEEDRCFSEYFEERFDMNRLPVETFSTDKPDEGSETLFRGENIVCHMTRNEGILEIESINTKGIRSVSISLKSLAGLWVDDDSSLSWILETSSNDEYCTLFYVDFGVSAQRVVLLEKLGPSLVIDGDFRHGLAVRRSNKLLDNQLIWIDLKNKSWSRGPKAKRGHWFSLKSQQGAVWSLVAERTHQSESVYVAGLKQKKLVRLPSEFGELKYLDIVNAGKTDPIVISVTQHVENSQNLNFACYELDNDSVTTTIIDIAPFVKQSVTETKVEVHDGYVFVEFNEALILQIPYQGRGTLPTVKRYINQLGVKFSIRQSASNSFEVVGVSVKDSQRKAAYAIDTFAEIPNGSLHEGEDSVKEQPEHLRAVSKDGTEIPLLLYRAPQHEQFHRAVIMSYGVYGENMESGNSDAEIAQFLEAGISVAVAYIRGGGELGDTWHKRAIGVNKKRSAEDLIACAEFLVNENICLPGRVGTISVSAGSSIAGAAINISPSAFGASVFVRPFLDVLGGLLDPDMNLTESDWSEWGNPTIDDRIEEAIREISPLSNLGSLCPILIIANVNDPRVNFSGTLGYVAKARLLNPAVPILLSAVKGDTHMSPKDRDSQLMQLNAAISWFTEHLE